jgi:hypothetical protein
MITRINPPIPLDTIRGKGYAHLLIDYSQEHNLIWVVFIDETGECWNFENKEVRLQTNLTFGRNSTTIQQQKE